MSSKRLAVHTALEAPHIQVYALYTALRKKNRCFQDLHNRWRI